jgi:hypothetical protein
VIAEIEAYVRREIEKLTEGQKITLKALIFAGYRGEREELVKMLIEAFGGDGIKESPLVESFTYTFSGEEVRYWRILPEYYRAVRKIIFGD